MLDSSKNKGLRNQLVLILKEKGIKDLKVLNAINSVPRQWFMDLGIDSYAYSDKAYPIGEGQTISQPYTVAYQTELLKIKTSDKILEIGTWKGASVAAFFFYFNKAKIYCLDRNFKLKFKSKRLKFFSCNTSNFKDITNLNKNLFKNKENTFDLVIDDGSHIYSDILKNLIFFFKKVKSGGYYVIEDFNHYKFYNELNDKDNNSLEIQDVFQHIVKKIKFESITINENFQIYCFDNISKITIHKGIQKDSLIAFIKKK